MDDATACAYRFEVPVVIDETGKLHSTSSGHPMPPMAGSTFPAVPAALGDIIDAVDTGAMAGLDNLGAAVTSVCPGCSLRAQRLFDALVAAPAPDADTPLVLIGARAASRCPDETMARSLAAWAGVPVPVGGFAAVVAVDPSVTNAVRDTAYTSWWELGEIIDLRYQARDLRPTLDAFFQAFCAGIDEDADPGAGTGRVRWTPESSPWWHRHIAALAAHCRDAGPDRSALAGALCGVAYRRRIDDVTGRDDDVGSVSFIDAATAGFAAAAGVADADVAIATYTVLHLPAPETGLGDCEALLALAGAITA